MTQFVLKLGGTLFEFSPNTLKTVPEDSYLANCCRVYEETQEPVFVEQNPQEFQLLLDYLRRGSGYVSL